MNEVDTYADAGVNLIMVGNKCDIDDNTNVVKTKVAEAYAKKHKMMFFETSAKTNKNIDKTFR